MRQVEIRQEVFITVVVGWVTEHVSVTNTLVVDTLYHTEQADRRQIHVQVLETTVGAVVMVLYVLNSSKVNLKNSNKYCVRRIKWHK